MCLYFKPLFSTNVFIEKRSNGNFQSMTRAYMEFNLVLYILFSAVVGIGGTYYLIESDRTLGGFLYFVGAALILTFYGLRWFSGDSLKLSQFDSKTWPPVVNVCPDFLSVYERSIPGSTTKEKICVDLVGVSQGGIQKLVDPANVVNDNFVFKLHMGKKGAERMKALCDECRLKKVTWEGVYDGVSCTATGAVPNADGSEDTSEGEKCD
jgi:hypothetical protein